MKQLGYIYLIIYAFLLALICVFVRHIHGMDMQTIAFMRALLAVVFIVWVIIVQRDWKALKLVDLPNTLIVGIAHSGMLLLYIGAFMNTSVANTILLTYLAPCFALLFTKFYFKQEIPNRTFGNLAFSLVGLILVAGPQDLSLHSQEMMGNLMALGAGFTYAVMMVWSKPLSQKVSGSYIVFWQHLVATIVLLPFASVTPDALLLENALPLAGLGFLSTGLAFLLLMFGLRLVPTHHALIMTSLEPVIAIGIAALLLQESLSVGTSIGAGLIVLGAYRITVATSGSIATSDSKQAIRQARSTYPEKFRTTSPKTEMGQNFSGEIYTERFGRQFGYFEKNQMKMYITKFSDWLYQQAQQRHAILLPMRLFIGLGWLRSSVEKLIDPDWYTGVALNHFFFERIAEGDVAFPFYQFLMEGLFSTHAPLLSTLIIVGEFYCGIAILFGLFMRPALLAGMFMNLNIILAGSVNPSIFYIVIQLTLLGSAVGQVFGFDSLLLHKNPVAEAISRRLWSIERANDDVQPVRQNPIPEYIPQRAFNGWWRVAGFEQSTH